MAEHSVSLAAETTPHLSSGHLENHCQNCFVPQSPAKSLAHSGDYLMLILQEDQRLSMSPCFQEHCEVPKAAWEVLEDALAMYHRHPSSQVGSDTWISVRNIQRNTFLMIQESQYEHNFPLYSQHCS